MVKRGPLHFYACAKRVIFTFAFNLYYYATRMSYLLKDLYSEAFYNQLSNALTDVLPHFNKAAFFKQIYTDAFTRMELKERMRHTTKVMHEFMPKDYKEAASVIKQVIDRLRQQGSADGGLPYMFLPDYIEVYGLDDYETSVNALEFITQFISCEFAVRPFLLKYPEQMIAQMQAWSLHESYKVRRFASEGSRSRLPWAMAVPILKKDPQLILPILENLKDDPHEWVRRSVANSLNDITRDHPGVVLQTARNWQNISPETDAIIKHGCRTLLKQGHPEILSYYGLNAEEVALTGFNILTPSICVGESVAFEFEVQNQSTEPQKVRLEYAVFYRMQNGKPSKKMFKISERIYQPKEKVKVERKQKFIIITTRKFYCGTHQLSVIVNGQEKATGSFELCPA